MADEIEVTVVSDRQLQQRKYGPRAADQPYGIIFSSDDIDLEARSVSLR